MSDPRRPVYVANLPTQTTDSLWRDIKTYDNHAFVVSEAAGHGLQVFDLTRLRDIEPADMPVDVEPDAHYAEFGNSHNLVINEDSGFAYAVGTTAEHPPGHDPGDPPDEDDSYVTCNGGLHMIDIRDPQNPQFAGCYGDEGYTHDANCVTYHGPDDRFVGNEICFASNPSTPEGDAVSIVDVTDKDAPQLLSRGIYSPTGYSHQGWVTDDHRFYLHDDELNELQHGLDNTLTHLFEISDLTDPDWLGNYEGPTQAIPHNLYNRGRFSYQANYEAGLRIKDLTGVADGVLEEVAYFDVKPERTATAFGGAWSNYPFFDSGNVLVGGFDGLWVVRPRLPMHAPWPPPGHDHRNPRDLRP